MIPRVNVGSLGEEKRRHLLAAIFGRGHQRGRTKFGVGCIDIQLDQGGLHLGEIALSGCCHHPVDGVLL